VIDVRLPTIGSTGNESHSQNGPRDSEEDRPELGPLGDRSRFTKEAVLGNEERRSTRNVDDRLPGHDRISLPEQTDSLYTCPYNMVNFGPLAAEIEPVVNWGTHANFNGFHVLAASLHGSQVLGVSQT